MVRGHILSRATCTTVHRPGKPSVWSKSNKIITSRKCFGVPDAILVARSRHSSLLVVRATDDEEEYDAELDAMDRMDKSITALQTELAAVRAGANLAGVNEFACAVALQVSLGSIK